MMMKTLVRLALACSMVGVVSVSVAHAQVSASNRTVMTFSQPVEVPGKVLPAGTYTFELHDSGMNRHVVEIFDQAGTKLIALVLAIPDYRLKATEETVIKFNEVAPGQPQAIRAWFYPGQTVGQELVYSKSRARELAAATNVVVPAADDTVYVDPKQETLQSTEVVAMTPERNEAPVSMIQMTPAEHAAMMNPETRSDERKELPHTASNLPTLAMFGIGLVAVGFALRRRVSPRTTR
jgi:hypothetical protein